MFRIGIGYLSPLALGRKLSECDGIANELQVLRFIKATTSIHMTFKCHFTWLYYTVRALVVWRVKKFLPSFVSITFSLLDSPLFGYCRIFRHLWIISLDAQFAHSIKVLLSSFWHWNEFKRFCSTQITIAFGCVSFFCLEFFILRASAALELSSKVLTLSTSHSNNWWDRAVS